MSEFMPLSELYCQMIEPDERFIISYPRSGSRWLRLALADLVNQHHGMKPEQLYSQRLSRELLQPEASLSQCIGIQHYIGIHSIIPEAIVKTRAKAKWQKLGMKPISRSHNLSQVIQNPGVRVVYMFRDPAAALNSYFCLLRQQNHEFVADGDLGAFCWKMIESWTEHVSGALTFYRNSPDRTVLLQYEKPQPVSSHQLRMVATFLHVEHTTAMIDGAMTRLRTFLEKLNQESGINHQRGGSDDLRRHMSFRTWAKIQWRTRSLYLRAKREARVQLGEFASAQVPRNRAA